MYCHTNFKTKKALKEAVAAGKKVRVFQPGPFNYVPLEGEISIEGPHYPEPHKWYAQATLVNGEVTKVK